MTHRFLQLVQTPSVKDAQTANGSRAAYAGSESGPLTHDQLSEAEATFIAARDSFYLASVSETGWPYIQHRGGPVGFLKVLNSKQLGFADFRGNRQYVTLGNAKANDRVALFLMDYPNRRRLKILGRMRALALASDSTFASELSLPNYKAKIERGFIIDVEAFDWNCPQHITPRFSESELAQALAPMAQRLAQLEAENQRLKAELSS